MDIRLPEGGITAYHASKEHLNKLIGCTVNDHHGFVGDKGKINSLYALVKIHPVEDLPDRVVYETEKGRIELDFLVALMLIECGEAMDTFGYCYSIKKNTNQTN